MAKRNCQLLEVRKLPKLEGVSLNSNVSITLWGNVNLSKHVQKRVAHTEMQGLPLHTSLPTHVPHATKMSRKHDEYIRTVMHTYMYV